MAKITPKKEPRFYNPHKTIVGVCAPDSSTIDILPYVPPTGVRNPKGVYEVTGEWFLRFTPAMGVQALRPFPDEVAEVIAGNATGGGSSGDGDQKSGDGDAKGGANGGADDAPPAGTSTNGNAADANKKTDNPDGEKGLSADGNGIRFGTSGDKHTASIFIAGKVVKMITADTYPKLTDALRAFQASPEWTALTGEPPIGNDDAAPAAVRRGAGRLSAK